jgi:hypothetical protein
MKGVVLWMKHDGKRLIMNETGHLWMNLNSTLMDETCRFIINNRATYGNK